MKIKEVQKMETIGRNDACWCGSGKKYKKCQCQSDEKLKEYYEFLNIQPQIHEINEIWQEVWLYADQNIIGKRLEKYSKDDAFMKKLQTIMEHDTEKHKYLFHGTQVLEDSPSILKNGLLMMRKDLGSTTVKEMTQEELLLYERRRNDGKYWNRICCNN